ncbi:MOSC domain-containing protein [Evansella cellulosilytica]|uniref:MOSC domain containing protein n=1 Tax=Evansella cellulosilytica (strain ATCC 21833 / DSM 2522 / FERM P-1141 / JCM 9156 / N-4) TaxID=649639 RepID=E6U0Z3_EVAC2|nr:MOSC domain-containing protein [Evansella cellulosilytica]ADU30305.1 MOSC domain containing protein [Evansella cellulosilytica DSM 2522]
MTGKVQKIWIKRMAGGPMDEVDEAILIKEKGIVHNADQGGKRQVTFLEEDVWSKLMDELNANLDPATRRANFLVKGINLKNSRGKILQIGECEVKIHGETKPCRQMDEALPGLKDAMFPDWGGGAFGTIISGGKVKQGDEIVFK